MSTDTRNTHTIQAWPRGTGYEYVGDPWSSHREDGDQLRVRKYNGEDQEKWRAGTPEEWSELRIAVRAERYVECEVLKCDSSLVGDLLQHGAECSHGDLQDEWTYENVTGLYPDPEAWDAAACREWLAERGIEADITDPPRIACENHAGLDNVDGVLGRCEADGGGCELDDDNTDYCEELRDAIRDNAEGVEVYEWWAISEWLAGELTTSGEPVLENNYGYWWGRTCTGQAMIMDGTLQTIARRLGA